MNPNTDSQEAPETLEASPLDSMISQVDSYIKNPKLVTPETLTDLKSQLEDLKGYMDQEESSEPSEEPKGGVAIMIHGMKGKK